MSSGVDQILETYSKVVEGAYTGSGSIKYQTYVVSNLRGGVGKSTLSFNLAFELSRRTSLLVADLCPQRNLTETILQDYVPQVTISHALKPRVLGVAFGEQPEDISYRVSNYCDSFKGGKRCYFVPGDPDMFAFPSALYQQLQLALTQSGPKAVGKILTSLKEILSDEAEEKQCEKILIDASPFYGGGTHLSWCAADALIIPVRVDEHSIESLELTLNMVADPNKDFMQWNERAGGFFQPKVAAIVMTMVGTKSQKKNTPDAASRMYIGRALDIAEKYHSLFDYDEPSEAFVITDDFLSSGRISGAKSIPISELRAREFFTIQGKRLQVNTSVNRYKNELKYLASIL